MESKTINYTVPAGAGKTYIRIAFEVPENIEYLRLSGDYSVKGAGGVDIGLEDAEGHIRGWSGNLKRIEQILLAEEQASYGYLAGALQAGTWYIILGDRQEHKEPIYVSLSLELLEQRRRIVRGDIHGHSYYSDGTHSIEEKLAMAQDQGLDFLGFTDHNSVAQNFNLPKNPDVLLLPSCEITTYNGHINIFGYHKQSIPNFMYSNSRDLRQGLEELKSEGVCLQLNHPIRGGDLVGCQWNWSYDMPFDWIEIWNGSWNENCIANLKLWQSFLEQGHFLPAVGNSDFHSRSCKTQGHPCNNVWVEKKTAKAIFSALAKGHNYLTENPSRENSFTATCYAAEEFIPFGSTIGKNEIKVPVLLRLETSLKYGQDLIGSGDLLLRLWSECGLHKELSLSLQDFSELEARVHYELEVQGVQFLRFELLHNEKMLLLSNPIFFA